MHSRVASYVLLLCDPLVTQRFHTFSVSSSFLIFLSLPRLFTSTKGKGALKDCKKKQTNSLSLSLSVLISLSFFLLFFFATVCRRVEDVVHSASLLASERVLNKNHEKKRARVRENREEFSRNNFYFFPSTRQGSPYQIFFVFLTFIFTPNARGKRREDRERTLTHSRSAQKKKRRERNAVRELSQRFSEYHQQNDDEDHIFVLLLLLIIIIISVIAQNDDVCSTPKKTTERNDESAFFFSFQTTKPKNDDDVNFSERRTTQKEEYYQRSNDDIDIRIIRKRRRRKRKRIESTKIIAFCFGRRNGVVCRWRERSASQPIGSVRDDNDDIAARLGVGGIERRRFRSRNRKDNRQYSRSVICGV